MFVLLKKNIKCRFPSKSKSIVPSETWACYGQRTRSDRYNESDSLFSEEGGKQSKHEQASSEEDIISNRHKWNKQTNKEQRGQERERL